MTIHDTLKLAGLCAIALAASALASTAFAATPNQLGTPNDGVVCPGSYTPSFNGTSLKCSKASEIKVPLACLEAPFTVYVARAPAGGTPAGLDVCTKPGGVTISATDDISSLVKGKDYVFAKADTAQIAVRTANVNQAEATALNVPVNEVETEAGTPVTDTSSGDSFDKSKVPLTTFAFAKKTIGILGPIGGPIIVGP